MAYMIGSNGGTGIGGEMFRKAIARLILCAWPSPDAPVFRDVDDGGQEGFATVDALVALTILSSTLILTIGATHIARRAASAALETRRASEVLQYVLLSQPTMIGVVSGQSSGFAWRLDTSHSATTASSAAPSICTRKAEAVAERTGRHFRLETEEICPQLDASRPSA